MEQLDNNRCLLPKEVNVLRILLLHFAALRTSHEGVTGFEIAFGAFYFVFGDAVGKLSTVVISEKPLSLLFIECSLGDAHIILYFQ